MSAGGHGPEDPFFSYILHPQLRHVMSAVIAGSNMHHALRTRYGCAGRPRPAGAVRGAPRHCQPRLPLNPQSSLKEMMQRTR